MVRLIIQVCHLTHRPQLLQYSAEFWCTVWIGCSAKSHNSPINFRVGHDVAAAPECLIVRMGNDNCGVLARARYRLILLGRRHCFPPLTPRCQFLISSFIQPRSNDCIDFAAHRRRVVCRTMRLRSKGGASVRNILLYTPRKRTPGNPVRQLILATLPSPVDNRGLMRYAKW